MAMKLCAFLFVAAFCFLSACSKLTLDNDVQLPLNVEIPNSFSPNGDGMNDSLIILGDPRSDFRFFAYDDAGVMVWETEDISKPWGGTKLKTGILLPAGTYRYYVQNAPLGGSQPNGVGFIELIR